MEDLADAEREVSSATSELQGTLRVTLPMSFGWRYLTPVMINLVRQHPGLHLEVSFTDRTVDLVEEGYDAAVRGGNMRPSSLVARRLAPLRLIAAASPAFLEEHGPVEHPSDLARVPALLYRQTAVFDRGTWSDGRGQSVDVHLRGRLVSDSGDMLLAAAVAGLGVLVQPEFLLVDDLVAGRLVPVLRGWTGGESAMWVVQPHRRHTSHKVRALVAALRDPPWRAPLEALCPEWRRDQ